MKCKSCGKYMKKYMNVSIYQCNWCINRNKSKGLIGNERN